MDESAGRPYLLGWQVMARTEPAGSARLPQAEWWAA